MSNLSSLAKTILLNHISRFHYSIPSSPFLFLLIYPSWDPTRENSCLTSWKSQNNIEDWKR